MRNKFAAALAMVALMAVVLVGEAMAAREDRVILGENLELAGYQVYVKANERPGDLAKELFGNNNLWKEGIGQPNNFTRADRLQIGWNNVSWKFLLPEKMERVQMLYQQDRDKRLAAMKEERPPDEVAQLLATLPLQPLTTDLSNNPQERTEEKPGTIHEDETSALESALAAAGEKNRKMEAQLSEILKENGVTKSGDPLQLLGQLIAAKDKQLESLKVVISSQGSSVTRASAQTAKQLPTGRVSSSKYEYILLLTLFLGVLLYLRHREASVRRNGPITARNRNGQEGRLYASRDRAKRYKMLGYGDLAKVFTADSNSDAQNSLRRSLNELLDFDFKRYFEKEPTSVGFLPRLRRWIALWLPVPNCFRRMQVALLHISLTEEEKQAMTWRRARWLWKRNKFFLAPEIELILHHPVRRKIGELRLYLIPNSFSQYHP